MEAVETSNCSVQKWRKKVLYFISLGVFLFTVQIELNDPLYMCVYKYMYVENTPLIGKVGKMPWTA